MRRDSFCLWLALNCELCIYRGVNSFVLNIDSGEASEFLNSLNMHVLMDSIAYSEELKVNSLWIHLFF